MPDFQSKQRLIAAVVHDVLSRETFESLADVNAAVCERCARLRLHYDADVVTRAIAFVNHTRPVLRSIVPVVVSTPPAPPPDVGKGEAAELYHAIMARWQAEQPSEHEPVQEMGPERPEHFPDLRML